MAKKSFMNNFKCPLTSDELQRAFYVDFEGHQDDSSIKDMLDKLRNHSTFLKILGSYPIAKLD